MPQTLQVCFFKHLGDVSTVLLDLVGLSLFCFSMSLQTDRLDDERERDIDIYIYIYERERERERDTHTRGVFLSKELHLIKTH